MFNVCYILCPVSYSPLVLSVTGGMSWNYFTHMNQYFWKQIVLCFSLMNGLFSNVFRFFFKNKTNSENFNHENLSFFFLWFSASCQLRNFKSKYLGSLARYFRRFCLYDIFHVSTILCKDFFVNITSSLVWGRPFMPKSGVKMSCQLRWNAPLDKNIRNSKDLKF